MFLFSLLSVYCFVQRSRFNLSRLTFFNCFVQLRLRSTSFPFNFVSVQPPALRSTSKFDLSLSASPLPL